MASIEMVRQPRVSAETGRKRTVLYSDIREGVMVPPVKIGRRASAWPRHEIEAINAAKLRGATDAEIKALVQRLIAERKAAA